MAFGHDRDRIKDDVMSIKMIATLALIVIALGFNKLYANKNIQTRGFPLKYVSMECQEGDITLSLNDSNVFDLTIAYWDSKTNSHVRSETVHGGWVMKDKLLILSFDNKNAVIYEASKTHMKIGELESSIFTYKFKSGKAPFFGSNIDLLEQNSADDFLINSTSQGK